MGNYNIGPKIGIEGEREFRQQLKNINDSYKALEAETRAVTAVFEANGDEQGKLEATSKQLQKQIDLQKEKMALLQDAVKKASEKYDENSIEVTRLRGALYNAQATLTGLENELKDTEAQLNKSGDALDKFGEDTVEAGKDVIQFGDILKANLVADLIEDGLEKAGEIVKDFASGTIEAAADVKAANAQFSQTFGDMEGSAKASLDAISKSTNIAATRMQGNYTKIFAFAKTAGAETEAAMDIASRAMLAATDSARDIAEEKEKKLQAALTAKNTAYDKLYAAQQKYSTSTDLTTEQANELMKEIGNLGDEYDQLYEEYLAQLGEIDEYRNAVAQQEADVNKLSETVNSYSDQISIAEDAMELYNQTLGDTDTAQNAANNSIENIKQKMEELSTSYQDAKNAAREAISSQIGMFDELSTTSDWTAEKVIANWKSQREAFANYQTNLKKAKSLGLDDTIVEQLSDGSAESMQILGALVNDTHIRVADINKAFEELERSKDSVSYTLADIQIDFNERMDELRRQAGIWGKDVGASFVDGLSYSFGYKRTLPSIPGLNDQIGRAVNYPNLYSATPSSLTSTTNTKTVNMGGITVQINAQPGQDVYEIAQAVQEVLQNEIDREEAGL